MLLARLRRAVSRCQALDGHAVTLKMETPECWEALGNTRSSIGPVGRRSDAESDYCNEGTRTANLVGDRGWRSFYSANRNHEDVEGLRGSPGRSFTTQFPKGEPKKRRQVEVEINMEVVGLATDVVQFCRMQQQQPPHDKAVMKLDEALSRIHCLLKSRIHGLDAINVATMIHQLASIAASTKRRRHILGEHFHLMSALLGLAMEKINEFEPNHISQIVWACGKFGADLLIIPVKDGNASMLVGKLLTRAAQDVSNFTPMNITQLVHGLALLKYQGSQEFMQLMTRMASIQLRGFTPQGLSILIWALAKLGYQSDLDIVTRLCIEIKNRVHEFEPQSLSNITWALAVMSCHGYQSVLHSIENAAVAKSSEFYPQEMANLLWGFVQLLYHPSDRFLESAATIGMRHLFRFRPEEISCYLQACADLGYCPKGLIAAFKALVRVLEPSDLLPRHFTSMAWSLAMLGELDKDMFVWMVKQLENLDIVELSDNQKRQLFQCLMSSTLAHSNSNIWNIMPQNLEAACRDCWIRTQTAVEHIPPRVVDVISILLQMGFKCNCPNFLEGGLVSASTAVDSTGAKFAVEIINPARCFLNNPNLMLGRYLWREKILSALGWDVLRIRLSDWLSLNTLEMKRQFLSDAVNQLTGNKKVQIVS